MLILIINITQCARLCALLSHYAKRRRKHLRNVLRTCAQPALRLAALASEPQQMPYLVGYCEPKRRSDASRRWPMHQVERNPALSEVLHMMHADSHVRVMLCAAAARDAETLRGLIERWGDECLDSSEVPSALWDALETLCQVTGSCEVYAATISILRRPAQTMGRELEARRFQLERLPNGLWRRFDAVSKTSACYSACGRKLHGAPGHPDRIPVPA